MTSSEPSLLCLLNMAMAPSYWCWFTFGREALFSAGSVLKVGASGVASDVVIDRFSLPSTAVNRCRDDGSGELISRLVTLLFPVSTLFGSGPSTFRPFVAPLLSFHSFLIKPRIENGFSLGGRGTETSFSLTTVVGGACCCESVSSSSSSPPSRLCCWLSRLISISRRSAFLWTSSFSRLSCFSFFSCSKMRCWSERSLLCSSCKYLIVTSQMIQTNKGVVFFFFKFWRHVIPKHTQYRRNSSTNIQQCTSVM